MEVEAQPAPEEVGVAVRKSPVVVEEVVAEERQHPDLEEEVLLTL